jgi:signal transduction histidine kinase
VTSGAPQRERQPQVTIVARPLGLHGRRLAVVAAVSMASVEQIETNGRAVLFWFAIPTIAIVTLLIDGVLQRLIHKPVGELRQTIGRVSAGDLSSRAAVVRDDELGTVAAGLNGMLQLLDRANDVLQQKVADRTSELRLRNAELEESNQRMLVLREALTRAERMAAVGQMAASVAHQVGTPLNLVSGYVQMIREDRQTDEAVRDRLGIVETQLQQVTHVLQTVLDRARQPPSRQPMAVAALIERVGTIARPRLARSGIALETTLDGGLGEINGDAAQLEIALLSVITNAIDAMPDGGTLRVRGSIVTAMVHLEISDTGHGISPELMPRLFDPWVTTKPEGHGTGLGLGIVREVIQNHGGRVTAHSAPGEGATFVIELPVVEAPARPARPAGDPARLPQHVD